MTKARNMKGDNFRKCADNIFTADIIPVLNFSFREQNIKLNMRTLNLYENMKV